MKFDQAQMKIALALFIVGVISTSLLAGVDYLTKGPIEAAEREALHQSLNQVLPEHTNDALSDSFTLPLSDKVSLQVFPAKDKAGKVLAYAWEQVAPDGYSGTIKILMGVRPSDEIVAIRVTQHQETPGLGDGITRNEKWLNSFIDKVLKNTAWYVKKDGGDFDQFTGATISPRAVVNAVHKGLVFFADTKSQMFKLATMPKHLENEVSNVVDKEKGAIK